MTALPYTGERAVPWNSNTGRGVMCHHVMRYAWACQFAWSKSVADLGCGAGYGSYMLAWVAVQVYGLDISRDALGYARDCFDAPNLHFVHHDITRDWPPMNANLCVAFEVIEHLSDPQALLGKVGVPLVWSIPVEIANAYHKRVYSIDGIHRLMDGSRFWYQYDDGLIRPALDGQPPKYVLGYKE